MTYLFARALSSVVERLICNEEIGGPSPPGSIIEAGLIVCFWFGTFGGLAMTITSKVWWMVAAGFVLVAFGLWAFAFSMGVESIFEEAMSSQ